MVLNDEMRTVCAACGGNASRRNRSKEKKTLRSWIRSSRLLFIKRNKDCLTCVVVVAAVLERQDPLNKRTKWNEKQGRLVRERCKCDSQKCQVSEVLPQVTLSSSSRYPSFRNTYRGVHITIVVSKYLLLVWKPIALSLQHVAEEEDE